MTRRALRPDGPLTVLLRGAMRHRGATLKSMGAALGMHQTGWHQTVTGKWLLPAHMAVRVATILDIPIGWLYQASSAQRCIGTPLEAIALKEYDDYLGSQSLRDHPYLLSGTPPLRLLQLAGMPAATTTTTKEATP